MKAQAFKHWEQFGQFGPNVCADFLYTDPEGNRTNTLCQTLEQMFHVSQGFPYDSKVTYGSGKNPTIHMSELFRPWHWKYFCSVASLGQWMQWATGPNKISYCLPNMIYICVKFEKSPLDQCCLKWKLMAHTDILVTMDHSVSLTVQLFYASI